MSEAQVNETAQNQECEDVKLEHEANTEDTQESITPNVEAAEAREEPMGSVNETDSTTAKVVGEEREETTEIKSETQNSDKGENREETIAKEGEPISSTIADVTQQKELENEVTSTRDDERPRSIRTSRRPSYNSGRAYVGGYQNYGLTYLPYKSNFEPSEDARRKADEFLKTLKL